MLPFQALIAKFALIMAEFFNVLPPGEALELLLNMLPERPYRAACVVDTPQALGRVAAAGIRATESLPAFARSTMDGYSLRAADTYGASDGLPAWFTLVGEVPMGRGPDFDLNVGEAAVAYTGGMLAGNADAVVMVEHTQAIDGHTIEVMRPVAPGENVAQPGEDTSAGEMVLPAGHMIRPQDIGALLALGIERVEVAQRPRVGILSMGDEVVPPGSTPGPGQVRDINTYTVAGQVEASGAVAVPLGLVGDDYEEQLVAARQGLAQCDMLVLSAGSSVSIRDRTVDIVADLGEPGPLVHGLALRPGKPAIVGLCDGKPVIGLPGNPASAMVVSSLLVRPVVYRLMGCASPPRSGELTAVLSQDIPSAAGREDYVPVRLEGGSNGMLKAHPVWGKSGFIFTLVKADGLVRVPADAGGIYAGETVRVREL